MSSSTSCILGLYGVAHLSSWLIIGLKSLLLAAPVEALKGMLLLVLLRHLVVIVSVLLLLLLCHSSLRMPRYQPGYFCDFTCRFRSDSPGSGDSLACETSLTVSFGTLLSWAELLLSRHHWSSVTKGRNLRCWVTRVQSCSF